MTKGRRKSRNQRRMMKKINSKSFVNSKIFKFMNGCKDLLVSK